MGDVFQASAITEAKLKMSDVGCALHICSLMHQRYADFTKTLFENWHRILLSTKKDEKVRTKVVPSIDRYLIMIY